MNMTSSNLETGLVRLANMLYSDDIYLDYDDCQKVDFRLYNEDILSTILKKFKFKDVGNVYDYPDFLPQPDSINGFDLAGNYDKFKRILISKKLNAVAYYTADKYSITCIFMIDKENLKKFSKHTKQALQQDSQANMFKDIDFKCEKREFIEIGDPTGDSMKPADVLKKKVPKENLVFDEGSTITEVMKDIFTFFKPETQDLYKSMEIAYKRGIILYGDPGNGKSAMIREIIRLVPDVTKIVINPNVSQITRILSSLINSLNGKKAIVIIEDIDSLITSRNRSEFLNILDGVDIKSGVYFIGTTNYPDQIDPAFMNRSGRFDRTYEIGNPGEETRRIFFASRNLGELLAEYKTFEDDSKPDSNEGVVELFTKYSTDLPMASLKEIMTSTQYLLAGNPDMSVEAAVKKTSEQLVKTKSDHAESHNQFKSNRLNRLDRRILDSLED